MGRTYAAVSVANILVRYGHDVLLVDMDLDAPSLPSLYEEPIWAVDDAPPIGIVPWFTDESGQLGAHTSLDMRAGKGRLRLIPAGAVGEHYVDSLLDERWRSVLEYEPEEFCRRLRSGIESIPDPPEYVIIDSRAGLAPMSGALVSHLADTIVFLFAGDYQSVYVANHLTLLRGPDRVIPVLSRFPQYLDPALVSLEENLARLENRAGLRFLHAAPGHEGSSVPTIGLSRLDEDSPLTLDHFRLAAELVPTLHDGPPANDDDLSLVWKRLIRTTPIDYKLFRIVATGTMVNMSDRKPNVAFRVDTISSIVDSIAKTLPPGHLDQALRTAGQLAGTAFGSSLEKDLVRAAKADQSGDSVPPDSFSRLILWCEFDAATGFGHMEPESDEDGELFIRIRRAFLHKDVGGALLVGYVEGVIRALLGEETQVVHDWLDEGTTLLSHVRLPAGQA